MPLQWRNQFWQSLEEGAGKRCSACELVFRRNGTISSHSSGYLLVFAHRHRPLHPLLLLLVVIVMTLMALMMLVMM